MPTITRIAVFCGSSSGNDPQFLRTAAGVGKYIAESGMEVIYGGAQVGLMGAVADAALSAGGKVTGIIPGFLKTKEIAHTGLTELLVVDTMHARKLLMHDRSDAIIALPGGYGTLEELFEMLTWAQLGLHQKPIGLLNVAGFYDGLIALADTMAAQGFLKADHRAMLLVADDVAALLAQLRAWQAPTAPKWITEETT